MSLPFPIDKSPLRNLLVMYGLSVWVLMLCAVPLALTGQGNNGAGIFPGDRHAELRKEVVFTPPDEDERADEQEAEPFEGFDWSIDNFNLPRPAVYGLLGLLLALLAVLVYRILGDVELRRRVKKDGEEEDRISIDEIEEEALVASGVSLSLQERAEKAGQFDVAVRLLYIQLLKDLQDNGYIKYRRDYSNRDYRDQLHGTEILGEFRDVTIDYERYWYGKYSIDPLSYRLVKRKFLTLTNRVRATHEPSREDV